MKLPTVRRDPTDASEPAPPLEITVTQTIDDRVQALVMQEIAYGVRSKGKIKARAVMWIWLWLFFVLALGFFLYDDIRERGIEVFLTGSAIATILPILLLLVAATVADLLWSRGAARRKRGKYRRYLTRLGETGQRAVTFRFDGEGITLTEEDEMAQLQPWHDKLSMTDEDGWLCFTGHMHELCIVIPKRDLSAQEIEAVERWNEQRSAAGPPASLAIQPDLAGAEIARSEPFTSSRDELIATVEETGNSQAWRTHRTKVFVAIAIALSLLTPAFYLIGWIIDPDRLPLAIALPIYLELFSTTFWKHALVAVAVLAVFAALNPMLRRWGARFYADQMLAAGLGESTVTVGEDGLLDDGTAIRMFIPWRAIRKCRITPEHIFLTIRLGAVLTYPKRVFPADKIAAIDALFREKAGRDATGGKSA
ncbi:hypothetical protein SAMN03159496_01545 [Rhizobium sp. NFR07]|uniref:YcxB family protein n=1 Tax=Rhizobium sp. NFR07 TaxID=1566262 RepID=UPI0008F08297|nr:YcxB family protein [Rhizobium sp. NFR07]SFB04959.1 hypothetical protein SAMN03159496_01545 [Rhizobium sp. NFR07]